MTDRIYKFTEIDSTNDYAKELIEKGEKLPFVVISNKQTKGRGRRGRDFFSPEGGFYYTYAFEAKEGMKELWNETPITILAAVATVLAIEERVGIKTEIKWINDIQLDGKKVGGILTEGILDNQGCCKTIVIGIGINLLSQEFPEEIREIAGSLGLRDDVDDAEAVSEALLEEITKNIETLIAKAISQRPEDRESILEIYRRRCSTLGKTVRFMKEGREEVGRAVGIDENGRLVVETGEGRMSIFSEIRIES